MFVARFQPSYKAIAQLMAAFYCAVRRCLYSAFITLQFRVRISSVFRESHHWLYSVGHQNTIFFSIFITDKTDLSSKTADFRYSNSTVAWESEESGCHLLWDGLRRVSHRLANWRSFLFEFTSANAIPFSHSAAKWICFTSSALRNLSCKYCRDHLMFGDTLYFPHKSHWKRCQPR